MSDPLSRPCTAFEGHRRLRSGPLLTVALAVKAAVEVAAEPVIVFDDATGRVVDLDLRGSDAEIAARLAGPPQTRAPGNQPEADGAPTPEAPRGRGRPRLGVVAREVTLLPRHWDWLAGQPGGASAALRRLVEAARRRPDPRARQRAAREAAYHFMLVMAGDMPGYEEATRALFAGDRAAFEARIRDWPADVRAHALRLAFPAEEAADA